jgi:hypothetical protein
MTVLCIFPQTDFKLFIAVESHIDHFINETVGKIAVEIDCFKFYNRPVMATQNDQKWKN